MTQGTSLEVTQSVGHAITHFKSSVARPGVLGCRTQALSEPSRALRPSVDTQLLLLTYPPPSSDPQILWLTTWFLGHSHLQKGLCFRQEEKKMFTPLPSIVSLFGGDLVNVPVF